MSPFAARSNVDWFRYRRLLSRVVGAVIALAVALGLARPREARGGIIVAPIEGLKGWNADTIAERNGFDSTPNGFDFNPKDPMGRKAWFVSNFDGKNKDGLPVSRFVESAFTNTVAGGNTLFQFQPYTMNNTLLLFDGATGTLTLAEPTAFKSIAILAASARGGGMGDAVVTYDDDTTLKFKYNAQDWQAKNKANPNVFEPFLADAFQGIDLWRYNNDSAGKVNMYETDKAVDPDKKIKSITFTGAVANGNTGIFAVSGERVTAAPEPSALVLGGVGACGLVAYAWRKRRKSEAPPSPIDSP